MKPKLQDINQKIMIHLQDLNENFKIKKTGNTRFTIILYRIYL